MHVFVGFGIMLIMLIAMLLPSDMLVIYASRICLRLLMLTSSGPLELLLWLSVVCVGEVTVFSLKVIVLCLGCVLLLLTNPCIVFQRVCMRVVFVIPVLWCGPRIASLPSPRYVVKGDKWVVLQHKLMLLFSV